ncbi:hypothetical protein BOSE62_130117 [Bosea sp. 62]|nr:hypothetical protein BOSE7B_120119 [Bosea sp. 7B]CAD5280126.1 hypothetical protein BOSE21B_30798 [Bosea sp. 21B]CAD5281248.1 hypothetical protein BOSE46_40434 [Bosea sp. 46]VVT59464.1 hypothetical protein BOS5A_210255 [Bosea sp. EC-HK365B]VXB29950.1 hypothetical protein BOSE62_130117 [Bosea sp. 62]VXB92294.1 hypothetical protein BOSE127_160148 [Bosea sp. 127]VXC36352.1 hypothetical protein BOSE29B_30761 [Bosea sp. 29B]VXC81484.1 hypothetical protein BOSE125_50435 [Bosea sp. 125]
MTGAALHHKRTLALCPKANSKAQRRNDRKRPFWDCAEVRLLVGRLIRKERPRSGLSACRRISGNAG